MAVDYKQMGRLAFAAITISALTLVGLIYGKSGIWKVEPLEQTDVQNAVHILGKSGIPILQIPKVGKTHHPAWIALYALAYAGVEAYTGELEGRSNDDHFYACISWLEENLKRAKGGLWTWTYDFDSTYNDITIKAPWSSAFAQATGIQAFLIAYRKSGEDRYLNLARKAALALTTPLSEGGLLFQSDNDIWFEEIPHPVSNPGHILNGHMRALIALNALSEAIPESDFGTWAQRGADTLARWLPRFDTGYWFRYDLNPRKSELLFRLVNPYGFPSHSLAIDRIELKDPGTGEITIVDVGATDDAIGSARIAGTDWGQVERIEDRTIRRLLGARLASPVVGAPHSYFYVNLPGTWRDNLSSDAYELSIEYLDDAAANISIQQRSIAPGPEFRDVRDGDLLLSGSGTWRRWIVPIRPVDLGYWVGSAYAEKHAIYLSEIATWDPRFAAWSTIARGYELSAAFPESIGTQVSGAVEALPSQTPVKAVFDLDDDGVIRQHASTSAADGIYHPYMIADQALTGGLAVPENADIRFARTQLRREPAIAWLLNPENQYRVGDAALYTFPISNAYNDVFTEAGWASSFFQTYALKALIAAGKDGLHSSANLAQTIEAVAWGFAISVQDGGVKTTDRRSLDWFEEVPNATHVLNAHLVTLPELMAAGDHLRSDAIKALARNGLASLREHLHLFDTGYWLRYDLNPRKRLLLQIDWLSGSLSPMIDEVRLYNPRTAQYVRLDVGSTADTDAQTAISGTEWLAAETIEDTTVRGFARGYDIRSEAPSGAALHNVFLMIALPDTGGGDMFDMPTLQLIVRYLDRAPGEFALKIQSIHEGSHLVFTPLRGGVVKTLGDQLWKEARVDIRPQDLGWYKGPDYQVYEVSQLERLSALVDDESWFYRQYALRHRHFLDLAQAGLPVIQEPVIALRTPPLNLSLSDSSPTYPGFDYRNALDGDPNDDYVAGIEGEANSMVELALETAARPRELSLTWESANNLARKVDVYAIEDESDEPLRIGGTGTANPTIETLELDPPRDVIRLRIVFSDFRGQNRLLLRLMEIR